MPAAPPIPAPPVAVGTHVMLRMAHIGALPATVERSEPGGLVVVLAVADNRVARLSGHEVAVEATTARGIQRFSGALQLVPNRPELVRVAIEGDGERIQRREWARVEAVVPITVTVIADSAAGGRTNTLNVSGGGVLISDPWRLALGIDVRIEIEPAPDAPPIRALGRVVREAAIDQKGIRIDDLSRDDEDRLVKFIRERERAALRTGRTR
jgi:c-di-GMP-binding flagellar brake protein YcgR